MTLATHIIPNATRRAELVDALVWVRTFRSELSVYDDTQRAYADQEEREILAQLAAS